MSFPKYEQYRSSGANWVGDIPAHWRVAALRWVARRYAGGTPDKANSAYWSNGTIPWLNSGSVNQRMITEASEYITEDAYSNSSARWVPEGALVMALAGQGKTKGMVAQLAIRATCNQSMAAIVPAAEVNPRYLYWWLDAQYQNIRNLAGGDLRDGLNLDLLGQIPCPLPAKDEQSSISFFLDRETAKIDELVAEQERLIELLEEKRQAVISKAITKGLDPEAQIKDSGVAWIGAVPAHWIESRLDRISLFINGKAHEPFFDDDGSFVCATSRFISTNGLAFRKCSSSLTPAQVDDVLMVMSDLPSGRALARTYHVRDQRGYAINQRVCAIRPLTDSSRFLFYVLNRNPWFLRNDDGLNQTHLSVSDFRKMPLFMPPRAEQQAIAERLDHVTAEAETLVSDCELNIALLQERRRALVSAAVTGQIDVRQLEVA